MELKDIKYTNNTGKLRKFDDGTPWYTLLPLYIPNGTIGKILGRNDESGDFMSPRQILDSSIQSGAAPETLTSLNIPNIRTPEKDSITLGNGERLSNRFTFFSKPKASAAGVGAAAITGIADMYSQYLSNRKYQDDYLQEGGGSYGYVDDIAYKKYNGPNMDQVKRDNTKNTLASIGKGAATGASIGSVVGPWGTVAGTVIGGAIGAVGGIIGANKNSEEAEKAKLLAGRATNFNRDKSASDALSFRYNKLHGNQENLIAFGAADGKLPKFVNGGIVNTAYGPAIGVANAKVSSGEVIIPKDGPGYVVPGSPNNKDTKLAYLEDGDMVAPNKDGISEYYQFTGDKLGTMRKINSHIVNVRGRKDGKLPGFKEGGWGNFISTALPSIASLGLIWQAGSQRPYKPNIYSPNRYESSALNTLSGLRINPYTIVPNLYNTYGRYMGALNTSGGLSAGLKAAAGISAMNQTQRNISDMFTNVLALNNSYLSNWANSALNAGQATAQRQMAADQYANEYYAKSHAARQQGIQMGAYNLINQLQNYYANEFKRRQFNETMDLYRSENELNLLRLLAEINKYNKEASLSEKVAAVNSATPTYFTTNSTPGIMLNSYITNPDRFYGRPFGVSVPSVLLNRPRYLY